MYRSKNILIFFVKKEAVELICSLYSLSVFICYRHGRASKTNFERSSVAKMYLCTVGISDMPIFMMLVSWNGIEDLNKTLIAGRCARVLYFLVIPYLERFQFFIVMEMLIAIKINLSIQNALIYLTGIWHETKNNYSVGSIIKSSAYHTNNPIQSHKLQIGKERCSLQAGKSFNSRRTQIPFPLRPATTHLINILAEVST